MIPVYLSASGPWGPTLAAHPTSPPQPVLLTGHDPLDRPDLPDLLRALDARGAHAVLHTTLPRLHDDQHVRPFASFDVSFRIIFPTADPQRYAARTGRDLDETSQALRNLQAFAYPFQIEVPLDTGTIPDLPITVPFAVRGGRHRPIRLCATAPLSVDDVAALGEALHAVDQQAIRPPPRLTLHGVPALALPVDALSRLDLRVDDPPDAPAPEPRPDPEPLARRRVWLATPPDQRPGYRAHPLDRFEGAVSLVQIRPPHPVYATILRQPRAMPSLAETARFSLHIAGRFGEEALAHRFHLLARALHDQVTAKPPADLARLRALAHVLRRSMKPRHDEHTPILREET